MSGRARPLTQQKITQRDATEGQQLAGIDVIKKRGSAMRCLAVYFGIYSRLYFSAGFFRKLFVAGFFR
jgi:hypothetical protein